MGARMTRETMATALGVTGATVYNYETDTSEPSRERMRQIAGVLGTTAAVLLIESFEVADGLDPFNRQGLAQTARLVAIAGRP